jgi:hypothetical protein
MRKQLLLLVGGGSNFDAGGFFDQGEKFDAGGFFIPFGGPCNKTNALFGKIAGNYL